MRVAKPQMLHEQLRPRAIAAAINRLIDEPEIAADLRAAANRLMAQLLGQYEWDKLVVLYRALPVASVEGCGDA